YIVNANKLRLTQALVNIINYIVNTLQGDSEPSIIIRAKKQESVQLFLNIVCIDASLKSADEDMSFEPFSDEPSNQNIKESQLSLSIAKHLVELMGGKISSYVDENNTIFEISLMSSKEINIENSNPKQISNNFSKPSNDIRKILYIEDNLMNIELMKSMLSSRNNLKLHISTSAEDGLEFLSKSKADIIFLDINLPNMNEHELLHTIKSNPSMKS